MNDAGEIVYSPPNFLKVPNRDAFRELAAQLAGGANYIRTVMAFEAAYHPNPACRTKNVRMTAQGSS